MPGAAWNAHLVTHPDHRARVFALFVIDHPDERTVGASCTSHTEVAAVWEPGEREAFGAGTRQCATPLVRCACRNTFCAEHTFACSRCGRFACLRHRYSGRCGRCARRSVRSVPLVKDDLLTGERHIVTRTYRKERPAEPWLAVVVPEDEDGSLRRK